MTAGSGLGVGGADRAARVGGLATDYADLAEKDVAYVVALLVLATQFVGWGEEGMFRGIGVHGAARPRTHRGQGRPLVLVSSSAPST